MADAQLVVYNDAGIEQISLGGTNLALVAKKTIAIGDWTTYSMPVSKGIYYEFTVTAKSPIVAIASGATGAAGAVYAQTGDNGDGTFTVSLSGGSSTPSPSVAGAVTLTSTVVVYVFDAAPAPSSGSGQGLILYDASGICIFNASYPAARVKQMVGSDFNPYGYTSSLTVPSGKTYAAILRSGWGEMYVESYNNTTGDRLVFDWRIGVSGGLPGTAIQAGTGGYSCAYGKAGAISTRAGAGVVGDQWLVYGCSTGSPASYFVDALVLDVTNL